MRYMWNEDSKWSFNKWDHPFALGITIAPGNGLFQLNLGWFGVAIERMNDPCTCPSCSLERAMKAVIEERKAVENNIGTQLKEFTPEADLPPVDEKEVQP